MMDSSADTEVKNSSLSLSLCGLQLQPMMPLSKKAQFYATYRHQAFPFPNTIMHYIAMNPSIPKVYRKMYQTCKYFYRKYPILIIENLAFDEDGEWYKRVVDSNGEDFRDTVLENFSGSITYDEFTSLATNVEELNLNNAAVKYDDGSDVPLEKLVEAVPKLKELCIDASETTVVSSKTFTELLKVPHFLTLDFCDFYEYAEEVDLDSFYTYMKQNKRTKFLLYFADDVLSEAYKIRLEKIIDELIDGTKWDFKVPCINYDGLDHNKYKKICELYDNKKE